MTEFIQENGKKIDWNIIIIIIMPVLLLLSNTEWLFTLLGHADPWVYVGYFLNWADHLPFFESNYKISRLPWVLKGYFSYKIFPPLTANYVLHLGVYYTALIAFYLTIKNIFTKHIAILSTIVFGFYTHFHGSGGWDYHYTDSAANYLLSLMFLTFASKSRYWKMWLFLSGASFATAIHSNLFLFSYLPILAFWYLFFNPRGQKNPLIKSLILFITGGITATIVYSMINYLTGGILLFFLPQIEFTLWYSHWYPKEIDKFYAPLSEWVWFVFPAIFLLISIFLLSLYLFNYRRNRMYDRIAFSLLCFVITFAIHIYFHLRGMPAFIPDYIAANMAPAMFIALAGLISWLMENFEDKYGYLLPIFTLSIFLVPLVFIPDVFRYISIQKLSTLLRFDLTPPVVSLSIGLLAFAIAFFLKKYRISIFLFLTLLSATNLFAAYSTSGYHFASPCKIRENGYLAIVKMNHELKKIDPHLNVYLWYKGKDIVDDKGGCGRFDLSHFYNSFASTYGWNTRLLHAKIDKDFFRKKEHDFRVKEENLVKVIDKDTMISILTNNAKDYERAMDSSKATGKNVIHKDMMVSILTSNTKDYENAMDSLKATGKNVIHIMDLPVRQGPIKFTVAVVKITDKGFDKFRFPYVLFDARDGRLKDLLEKYYYGKIKKKLLSWLGKDPLRLEENGGIFFRPTSRRDHLATKYMQIIPGKKRGGGWLKITFIFSDDKMPGVNCICFLQDENFRFISQTIRFSDRIRDPRNGTLIEYVRIGDKIPNFRLVMKTENGRATYIPGSIKIEQSINGSDEMRLRKQG